MNVSLKNIKVTRREFSNMHKIILDRDLVPTLIDGLRDGGRGGFLYVNLADYFETIDGKAMNQSQAKAIESIINTALEHGEVHYALAVELGKLIDGGGTVEKMATDAGVKLK